MSAFRRVALEDAADIRAHAGKVDGGRCSPYQPVTEHTATGRSRCRACGQKIKKGDRALEFSLDTGGGSWTAISAFVHAGECSRS